MQTSSFGVRCVFVFASCSLCRGADAALAASGSRPAVPRPAMPAASHRRAGLKVATGAALGSFNQGFNTGVIAPSLLFIVPEFGLVQRPAVTGLIASSTTLGAILGTLVSGRLCDSRGRQKALALSALTFLAGGALMGWSPTPAALIAGRLVGGVAAGLASAAAPTYIAECAEPTSRGALSTLPQLCVSSGILAAYVVGLAALVFGGTWRMMLGASLLPAAAQLACVATLPESPRWLLSRRDDAGARSALRRLRGREDVDRELASIKAGLAREAGRGAAQPAADEPAAGGLRVLLQPGVLKVVLLCSALQMFQQFSGVNAIVYFTPQILREAGAHTLFLRWGVGKDVAAMLATVLAYLPKIPSVLLATFLIDRMGRRALLMRFVPPLAACLAALATTLGATGSAPAAAAATAAVMLFGVFFGMSLGPLPGILAAELFPTAARSVGVSACVTVQWLCNALVAAAFPVVAARFGYARVLHGFAAVCLAAWLVIAKFVPETRGVALEEIGRGAGAAEKDHES